MKWKKLFVGITLMLVSGFLGHLSETLPVYYGLDLWLSTVSFLILALSVAFFVFLAIDYLEK